MSQSESVSSPSFSGVSQSRLIPPWAFVIIGILSAEAGAGIAKQLFDAAGTSGVVLIRTLVAAIIFNIFWRPAKLRGYTRREYLYVVIYGCMIATMMLAFYVSISRIPLGVSVALSFCGPLGMALLTSRKASDLIWVLVAAIGIFLLSPLTNSALDPVGVIFALLSGLAWTVYAVISGRVAQSFLNNSGLAIGMTIAAFVSFPFGISGVLNIITQPGLMLLGVFVALLSSVVTFASHYQALKQLSPRTYGILSSLEPVAALMVGFLMLHEPLIPREVIGIILVTVATVATTREQSPSK